MTHAEPATPAPRPNIFAAWCDDHKKLIYRSALLLALFWLVVFPFVAVIIPPGHGGVYFHRFFSGTDMERTYREGFHLVPPWNRMYVYDLRLQQTTQRIEILSRGGLKVHVEVAIYYRPIPGSLPQLHTGIGENYREVLLAPAIAAATREVFTRFTPEELYEIVPGNLQTKIFILLHEVLATKNIFVDAVLVKKIDLPAFVAEAINKKYEAEQDYLRYHYTVLKAREELKTEYIRAESVRIQQELVNPGMTEDFLRFLGIKATRDLAASNNAKVVVIGSGKDGLPIILNMPDSETGRSGQASALPEEIPASRTAPAAQAVPDAGQGPPAKTPEAAGHGTAVPPVAPGVSMQPEERQAAKADEVLAPIINFDRLKDLLPTIDSLMPRKKAVVPHDDKPISAPSSDFAPPGQGGK